MNTGNLYPYVSDAPLHTRIRYNYSTFKGNAFLVSWEDHRSLGLNRLSHKEGRPKQSENTTPTFAILCDIEAALQAKDIDAVSELDTLDKLVQRFEVTKRLHDSYTENWRAEDKEKFHTLENYIIFSELLSTAYIKTGTLSYLNALLKLLDTLTSLDSDLPADLASRLEPILLAEREHISKLRQKTIGFNGKFQSSAQTPRSQVPASDEPDLSPAAPRTLEGVIMIACNSARSKAYIQSLVHNGLLPERVIFMGEEENTASDDDTSKSRLWEGILLPRLDEPVTRTCADAGIPVTKFPALDVNAPEMETLLREIEANIVIYSGRGGQIVSQEILNCVPYMLHMHSGWLPAYRGSTTLYYALLEGNAPSVTSLFLDKDIDTGPIFLKLQYPAPYTGMDVDLVYDSAIRADCLCQSLVKLDNKSNESSAEDQSHRKGRTFYVIHPVLKHIALLSLAGSEHE